jgi:PhnB protein
MHHPVSSGERGRPAIVRAAPMNFARSTTRMPALKPIPDGYHAVTPYLIVDDCAGAIAFYAKVFGATERMRHAMPDGRIGHAELAIGDSMIMLADAFPEQNACAPGAFGGSPVGLHLFVEDVDAVVARAISAGAAVIRPVADQFYSDRSGSVTDPFGHVWHVTTHIEDVSPDKIARRTTALSKGQNP